MKSYRFPVTYRLLPLLVTAVAFVSTSPVRAEPSTADQAKPALTATEYFDRAEAAAKAGKQAEAVGFLKQAIAVAETGTPSVRFSLAAMLSKGSAEIPRDQARALALIASSAKDGHLPAQWTYGRALMTGAPGVYQDTTAGSAMLAKVVAAIDTAPPEQKYAVGAGLMTGIPGLPKNEAKGVKLVEAAADADLPVALIKYGRALVTGAPGIPQNTPRGITYLKRAAALKVPLGALNVAVIYERGVGVPVNPKEALTWYRQSAELGEERGLEGVQRLEAPGPAPAATPTKP